MRQILVARARIQGFLVTDYEQHHQEAWTRLANWHPAGTLKYQYDIVEGLDKTPNAFLRVLTSQNLGKQLVKVGPEAEGWRFKTTNCWLRIDWKRWG